MYSVYVQISDKKKKKISAKATISTSLRALNFPFHDNTSAAVEH